MTEKVKRKEFIEMLAKKMHTDEATAERWLEAFIDIFFKAFKAKRGVSLTNFGDFYLQDKGESSIFKFNPSQKLRALLGWSSTYKEK